jgi:dTDP-4-dehydrorhamnose reductase
MIAILGSNGQLGNELCRACDKLSLSYVGLTHSNLGVEDVSSIKACFNGLPIQPTTIINTAAFHNVDACETQAERAWAVNAVGSANVAKWCRDNGAKYVYISTDYCGNEPTSVYAKTKLAGEMAALSICPDALVVRVGTLYGVTGCRAKNGGNFIDTVVAKVKSQEPFTLPDYTSVKITSAKSAAQKIISGLYDTGVIYATDEVNTKSHYKWGCVIAKLLDLPNHIKGINIDPDDVIRPHAIKYPNSYFNIGHESLVEYLKEKGYI